MTQVGPTGKFPKGKCRPDDKGELVAAMTYDPKINRVFIKFGTPVTYLAMTPDQAIAFAEVLKKRGQEGVLHEMVSRSDADAVRPRDDG